MHLFTFPIFLPAPASAESFKLNLKHMQRPVITYATALHRPTAAPVLPTKLKSQCNLQSSCALNMTHTLRFITPQQNLGRKYRYNQSPCHKITSAARARKVPVQPGIFFLSSLELHCIVLSLPVLNGHSPLLLKSSMRHSC